MDFSEEWKSLLPISSVHAPPLLLTGSSAKTLGPLIFSPSTQTLTSLYSSPSLSLRFSPPSPFSAQKTLSNLSRLSDDSFVPSSLVSSIAHAEKNSSQSEDSEPIRSNNLQLLRCPGNKFLVLFPSGENSDRVGCVQLSIKGKNPEVKIDKGRIPFVSEFGSNCRILKMMVTSVAALGSGLPAVSDHSITVGFLLTCTLYSVNWFRVDISSLGLDSEKPILVHLATKAFRSSVVHACWSPHLLEESIILLENGGLYLFDLTTVLEAVKFPIKLEGTRVAWENTEVALNSGLRKRRWLSCEFGWHPLIFLIACSSHVFLIDWRFEQSNVSVLATIPVFGFTHSVGEEQFLAFCQAGSEGFYFSVATTYRLLLLDIRKPLMPVLQWVHGLDKPRCMNVYRLSELRSTSEEDKYRWASESGFAILLGSLWNCEFSMFCYGPCLPTPYASIASKVSTLSNSLYAWELPSELSLSGHKCHCGDCYLREDFEKGHPQWLDWRHKKNIVIGFCIIGKGVNDTHAESEGYRGFRLIRLVSSGKLESQIYRVSWDFECPASNKSKNHSLPKVEDPLVGDQRYKFRRKFVYMNLEHLLAYMNGNLSKVLISSKRKACDGTSGTLLYTPLKRELLCTKLKAAGVDQSGRPPDAADICKDISLPMSIHEIGLCRTWASLPLDLLELAFSTNSELLKVLIRRKMVSMKFMDVPDLPQLPPFIFRRPSRQRRKSPHEVQRGDTLVGPSLPLPVVLTLREVNKKIRSVSEEEANGFSAKEELGHQCDMISRVITGTNLPGYLSEILDSHAVSLGDDRDENWRASQESTPTFSYKPSFLTDNNHTTESPEGKPTSEDPSFCTFISKTHEKNFSPNSKTLGVLEMYDALCPIELKFSSPLMELAPPKLTGYKMLNRHLLNWQKGSKQYEDFCAASKIKK